MDKGFVGRRGAPFEIVLELGKIREFARATRSTNPAYFEGENPPIPATFLMTAALWAPPEASPLAPAELDADRVLHGEQSFTFFGPPPRAGTRLVAQCEVVSVREREGERGGRLLIVKTRTTFTDPTGRLVAEARRSDIETRAARHERGTVSPDSTPQLGEAAPELTHVPVLLTDIVAYQGASGDLNPLHHDPGAATAAGYPGPFSVGMLQAGIMATQVTDWLGATNLRRFSVRFREIVWPGETLTYRAFVTGRDDRDSEITVELEMSATKANGALHATGSASFTIPT